MIVYEKNGQTQQVEEREATRIRILESMGWVRSDAVPVEVESAADGYNVNKTDADLARQSAQTRTGKRQRPTVDTTAQPTVGANAQRDITGQQPTATKISDALR